MAGEDLEQIWCDYRQAKEYGARDLSGADYRSGMQCPASGCFRCDCTGCYYADFIRAYWNGPHCD